MRGHVLVHHESNNSLPMVIYHNDTSKLVQPKYRDLIDFARLELNRDDYQIIHGTYELKTLMYILELMTMVE